MSFVFAGYFPKRIVSLGAWLKAPFMREIWSVSECISKGPPDWIEHWQHNDFGLFDSEAIAESVVLEPDRRHYTIVGYRVWDRMFDGGEELPLPAVPAALEEPEPSFASLGFDAVARSGMTSFDCSPLSCNGAARSFSANDKCLFRTAEEAMAGAKEFSKGGWEPGPYWVVEVLSRQ